MIAKTNHKISPSNGLLGGAWYNFHLPHKKPPAAKFSGKSAVFWTNVGIRLFNMVDLRRSKTWVARSDFRTLRPRQPSLTKIFQPQKQILMKKIKNKFGQYEKLFVLLQP